MTASLAWQPAAQGAELAERLRASQGSAGQAHDLVILCSGQTLFAHRCDINRVNLWPQCGYQAINDNVDAMMTTEMICNCTLSTILSLRVDI